MDANLETSIKEQVARGRTASDAIFDYTQEQVDAMVKAIGLVVYNAAEELSKMAVEETRMGTVSSKVPKHRSVPTGAWRFMHDKQSVGIIERDEVNCIDTYLKPMGVVCAVTPATNPTTTACANAMYALKGRNAIIVAQHPRADKCTAHCVNLMRGALKKLGAPEDLIQCMEHPSIEATDILMGIADVTVATGGAGMVKAAYSSGKPAYGVGQGNEQSILDDYADLTAYAKSCIMNRLFDNGLPCTGEQSIIVTKDRADDVVKAFQANGAYYIDDKDTIAKLRELIFPGNGPINRAIVGASVQKIAEMIGLTLPQGTLTMLLRLEKHGWDEVLCREVNAPISRLVVCDTFEDCVQAAKDNLMMEGAGHSACIWSTNNEHIDYAAQRLPVGRLLVNQVGGNASGGAQNNGLNPTTTIGCGSWGGNSISENLTYRHLMNVTKLTRIIPDAKTLTDEEVWAL